MSKLLSMWFTQRTALASWMQTSPPTSTVHAVNHLTTHLYISNQQSSRLDTFCRCFINYTLDAELTTGWLLKIEFRLWQELMPFKEPISRRGYWSRSLLNWTWRWATPTLEKNYLCAWSAVPIQNRVPNLKSVAQVVLKICQNCSWGHVT